MRENKWLASRLALDADIIIDEDGRLERLSDSIARLLESLTPVAKRLGGNDELAGVNTMLRRGPSSQRQRRLYQETEDFTAVMKSLVNEFREIAPVRV